MIPLFNSHDNIVPITFLRKCCNMIIFRIHTMLKGLVKGLFYSVEHPFNPYVLPNEFVRMRSTTLVFIPVTENRPDTKSKSGSEEP